jgi:uridine kinase
MAKIEFVEKRTGDIVPFTPDRITNAIYRAAVAVGGRDRLTAERLSVQVVAMLEERLSPGQIPTIEEIQDLVEKVLIENGHARVAKAYILYREERQRKRQERASSAMRPSENIPWAKLWHVLNWAVEHGVHTIQSYNQRLQQGELPAIIRAAEDAYHEDLENAVELVLLRRSELKLVIITGPSSSGKTTTTTKLAQRLKRLGIKLVTLNVDHYFYDLEMHPRDEFGDYDFETPQALDLELINTHLVQLISGQQVRIPNYDFKSGQRTLEHTPMRIQDDEIILIDSLHGLYPSMTVAVPNQQKFRLYLEPLLQMKNSRSEYIRWADIRMLRRMLRDAAHRAYDPTRTLLHWHYVRTSELRNIIPYIHTTDYVINSAMPYELSLYRPKLLKDLKRWVKEFRDDPLRLDAFERAQRTLFSIDEFLPVDDDSLVPSDSVIREFIGGSSLAY